MSYQSVIIVGTIGKDIELMQSQGGTAWCNFSVATSKKIKEKEVSCWHRCKAFGKTAEYLAKYAGKGSKIFVEGEISYGEYEKGGVKHYTTDIMAHRVELLSQTKKSEHKKENLSSSTNDDDVPF
jgi:single-strand DNA-binding protein